jgi:glyoxylase-like metal-dependent hydrolase (beta-lactamase superfamily II)
VTVHHLNCATMCPRAAGFLLKTDHMVAHCLLVETAKDGLVLVDTGFGTRDIEGATGIPGAFRALVGPRLDRAETAIAQVVALGFKPSDVRHLVITHLDLEHAGGMSDFPDAKVHLHAREHAAAVAPKGKEKRRYMKAHLAHGPKWELYSEDGETWRGLPAIAKLRGVDADIALVPMHGHTRGHSAIVVGDQHRWLVHAGDAYFHRNTVHGGRTPIGFAAFERMMQMDGAARRASVAALRQLAAMYDDLTIFSAHDPSELAAFG